VAQDHKDTVPRVERTSTYIDSLDLMMVNEENRRVEIRLPSDLPPHKKLEYEKRFFAPRLIVRKKNEILSEKIRFHCQIHSAIPVNNLTILVNDYQQDPFPIKVLLVDTIREDEMMNFALEWDGIKDNGQMIPFNKAFHFMAFVEDTGGIHYAIPIQDFYVGRDVIVKEKRIFALAKFNKVAPLHEFYLEQLDQVEDMMKSDNMVRIRFYGHTDMIGTEERNNELSADRATELSNWLARIIDVDLRLTDSLKAELKSRIDNPISTHSPDYGQKIKFGKGETSPLVAKNIQYGNNFAPQGRTLNRRVDIEIYRMGKAEKPALAIEKNITFHPWYGISPGTAIAKRKKGNRRADGLNLNMKYQSIYGGNESITAGDLYASTLMPFQNPNKRADSLKINASNTAGDSLSRPLSSSYKDTTAMPTPIEISPSLINQVTSIEFQDSLLWIGTENGLVKWNVNKDTFQLVGLNLWKYKHITALKYDSREECLWVGTKKGLREFAEDQWILDFNVGTGLSGNVIHCILRDKSGNLLLGTNEGINVRQGIEWKVLANVDSGLADDNVNFIYEDAEGILWAGTNKGVCFLDKEGTWFPFEGNNELLSDTVYCMTIDANGNKWFGTAEGLCRFNKNNKVEKFRTFDFSDKIRTEKILALATDASQTTWCATEHGLSVYQDGKWYSYNYNDGLPANYVNTICVGEDNKIYVGFYGGGVSVVQLP